MIQLIVIIKPIRISGFDLYNTILISSQPCFKHNLIKKHRDFPETTIGFQKKEAFHNCHNPYPIANKLMINLAALNKRSHEFDVGDT